MEAFEIKRRFKGDLAFESFNPPLRVAHAETALVIEKVMNKPWPGPRKMGSSWAQVTWDEVAIFYQGKMIERKLLEKLVASKSKAAIGGV